MSLSILPPERWPELTEIFSDVFNCNLPHPSATILAECDDDGKVTKFVVLEFLAKLGQIWQTGPQTRAMFDFFDGQIPPGSSVIAMPCEERMEGLCEKFGMYKIECESVWRKDYY